jgi:nitroreductase
MDVLEAIRTRRSVGRVREDAPPRELIEQLIEAAVLAPNHHETEPWRFFVLTGRAKEEFGLALGEAAKRRWGSREIDPAKLALIAETELVKTRRAPVLIVAAVKHAGDDPVVRFEDLAATAAAVENLLLAAHALGLGAQWRTGEGAYDAYVKAHFGLTADDEIAGIVYVGYPAPDRPAPRERHRNHADKTEWLGWE